MSDRAYQAFKTARDDLFAARHRYNQLAETGVTGFRLDDAETQLAVAEDLYSHCVLAWLASKGAA